MSIALKHVQAQPEPPSSRTELPIPGDLERIVMHCLASSRTSVPPAPAHWPRRWPSCPRRIWTRADARRLVAAAPAADARRYGRSRSLLRAPPPMLRKI